MLHRRLAGHPQVEQLDLDAGLPDVDADHAAVVGVDPQQYPRPAAVGVDEAGLDDQPVLDQLAGDVADRGHAEPGQLAELLPAQRAVEEQLRQQHRPVTPSQVAYRAAIGLHAVSGYVPSPVRSARAGAAATATQVTVAVVAEA